MSSSHYVQYANEENSNDEIVDEQTDTEDTKGRNEKSPCRKRSGTESDSTPSKKNKKVFLSEKLGQSKSTEEDTDGYTSSTSTIKHWRKNFRPRVSKQPITSALRKSGYISGKPKTPTRASKRDEDPNYNKFDVLPEPKQYYSDDSCTELDYCRDHHTPASLIYHDYIWQAKQQEVAELNAKGPAVNDATTQHITHFKNTVHNVQTPVEAIYEQRFSSIVAGSNTYLTLKKSLPTGDRFTYFTETTFIKYSGSHSTVQRYRLSSYLANNFNKELSNRKDGIEVDIYATWRISTIRYDCDHENDAAYT